MAVDNFSKNKVKGCIAEEFVYQIFTQCGFMVYRYGMEYTVPGIADFLRTNKTPVAMEIRRQPDFVVYDTRTKNVYFIEVKFRADGEFSYKDDLQKDYPYDDVFVVLVSRKHIKCITVRELKDGKEITSTDTKYLGSRKEFDMNKEIIRDFCDLAVEFFSNVK